MANPTLAELVATRILQSNPLATVTQDCIVIRDAAQRSHTIIAVAHVSGMKRISVTYPSLLVIASALSLIGAAALCSKEGGGAGLPISLLAGAFAFGYLLSRKAAVAFITGTASTETPSGSFSQVAALISAVQSAQTQVQESW